MVMVTIKTSRPFGRWFDNVKVFLSVDEANAFMEENPNWGALKVFPEWSDDVKIVWVAEKSNMGY